MKKSNYRKSDNGVRVAVVEDHNLVRQALVLLLKKEPQVVVAFQAENGKDFLDKLPNHSIDVVLLDLDMPVMNGRETLQVLRKKYPDVKPIILSMHSDEWIVAELIQEGARGFLLKNCTSDEMLDALFDVKFKGSHMSDIVERALMGDHEHSVLRTDHAVRLQISSRDHLILKMICDGKTSEEIADRMSLSKKSIDAIRSDLLRRIGAKNAADLVRKSVYLGLYKARSDEQIITEEQEEERSRQERRIDRLKQRPSEGDR